VSYDALYFPFFLGAVWIAFRILPWRGWVLLVASVVFYSVAVVRDSLLATALILFNFAMQFAVLRDRKWLYGALAVNFGCLAYFKYSAFLAGAAGFDLFTSTIVIPLGISFYVFQLSAFLVDLTRGRAQPFMSLPRFVLFKMFFGQLVAGPIMRWRQFGPQVHWLFKGTLRRHRLLGLGLGLCLLGLIKKVMLADSIGPIADTVFRDGPAHAAVAWLGLWLFSFQIYFDFSGYSDIAVGLSYLFGIRLAINFRQPYLSRSPQEFWRRWHITLSEWIRDYLYIPMGGNRGGWLKAALVLVCVMMLAGLWHGANWTFVVWGLGWALVIVMWRVFGKTLAKLGVMQWLLTLFLATLLWTFFRAGSLESAISYIGTLFGGVASGSATTPDDRFGGALIFAGCACLLLLHWAESKLFTHDAVRIIRKVDGMFLRCLFIGLCFCILLLPKVQDAPFIYFRF
jgi:alginate O-acetyltransferase complex protein AlgI